VAHIAATVETFVSLRSPHGPPTVSIRSPYGLPTVSLRSPYGVPTVSLRSHSVSLRSPYGVPTISLRSPYDLPTVSLRFPYDLPTVSVRCPYGVRTVSLRSHAVSLAVSAVPPDVISNKTLIQISCRQNPTNNWITRVRATLLCPYLCWQEKNVSGTCDEDTGQTSITPFCERTTDLRLPMASLIGCTSCIVKPFRCGTSLISSPLGTP